jgi:hypothetical protein
MIDNKIVICLEIMVVVFLFACSITLFQQTAQAQQKQTSTGNVTAQVVPQGTSLTPSNNATASTNNTATTSRNVTAQVVPQGTSLTPSNNATASTNNTATTSRNVTAQVVPQGTSLTPSNNATASTNNTATTSRNVTAQVVPQGTSSNGSQGSVSVGSKLNCQSIASTIGGIVVPNPSKICDVLIPRQAPTILGPGNVNMNKFSTINSIVEVASVSDLMTKQSGKAGGNDMTEGSTSSDNTSSQKVFVMGEFSLLDPQLVTMVKAAVGYNWTIAAVHNHMVLEKPKMMFVHWSAQGDLNTIINQIKNVLLVVSKVPSST